MPVSTNAYGTSDGFAVGDAVMYDGPYDLEGPLKIRAIDETGFALAPWAQPEADCVIGSVRWDRLTHATCGKAMYRTRGTPGEHAYCLCVRTPEHTGRCQCQHN